MHYVNFFFFFFFFIVLVTFPAQPLGLYFMFREGVRLTVSVSHSLDLCNSCAVTLFSVAANTFITCNAAPLIFDAAPRLLSVQTAEQTPKHLRKHME